jgi:hypothetical protein
VLRQSPDPKARTPRGAGPFMGHERRFGKPTLPSGLTVRAGTAISTWLSGGAGGLLLSLVQ